MASPSTSSSAASPHPGPSSAGNATQASGPGPAKTATSRDQAYLEAIPVIYPKIVPLEWSIPLIHRPRGETNDLGSLKSSSSVASAAETAAASLSTPSGAPGLPARLPSYLSSEIGVSTPASTALPLPSPGNTSALAAATAATGQSIIQLQKPWRIIWASYKAKDEDPNAHRSEHANSPSTVPHDQRSTMSTPQPGLLQVPRTALDYSFPGTASPASVGQSHKRKTGRARAASDASRRSGSTHASTHRHKKRRTFGHSEKDEDESPEAVLSKHFGEEAHHEYMQMIQAMEDPSRRLRIKALFDGKRRFLKLTPSSQTLHKTDETQRDAASDLANNPLLQSGHLPQRLAYVQPGPSFSSKNGKEKEEAALLYTFSMTSSDLDLSDYTGLDEANAYPDLELEASGTFTASDLFPSLYNDNGIYTSPSSMHPASIHPIPAAAALGAGQSGRYGKTPFFLSSLNISGSSNQEAIAASEAYLRAAETYTLDSIRLVYNPNTPRSAVDSQGKAETASPQTSTFGRGVRCDYGLLYPSLLPEDVTEPYPLSESNPSVRNSSVSSSPFISCQAHFTAVDLRLSVQVQQVKLRGIPEHRENSLTAKKSSMNNGARDLSRQPVLLCPQSVPAVFIRWYGEASNTVSPKQAEAEKLLIAEAAPKIVSLLQDYGCNDPVDFTGEKWALCALNDSLESAWPISLIVRLAGSPSSVLEEPSLRVNEFSSKRYARSAIAKASSRISRKLYFQPPKARSAELSAATASYIEQYNREKAKDRRDRAEKLVANKAVELPDSDIKSGSGLKSEVKADEPGEVQRSSMQVDVELPKQQAKVTYESLRPDSPRILNDLGCPTIGTITSALDSLLGPEQASPSPASEQPSILVGDAPVNGAAPTGTHGIDAGAVYPTPQSGPNSTNQASTGTAEYQETHEASAIQAFSPSHQANRSLTDIFQDFAWPNYTETSLAPSIRVPSRPQSAGGGAAFGPKGVFDDPSTFDFFDSAGLTEEDFSFFDSPIPSDLPIDNIAQQPLPDQNQQLPDLPAITADDIASFVNTTGPVDHFGHLMPRGESITQVTQAGSTNETFDYDDDSGSKDAVIIVHTRGRGRSQSNDGRNHHMRFHDPEDEASILHLGRASPQYLDEPARQEPILYKYQVPIVAMGPDSFSMSPFLEKDVLFRLKTAFGPISFLLPSPPSSTDSYNSTEYSDETRKPDSCLIDQKRERANRMRAALSRPHRASESVQKPAQEVRTWHDAASPVGDYFDSSSDSSSASSSDEHSDDTAPAWTKRLIPAKTPRAAGALPIYALYAPGHLRHPPRKAIIPSLIPARDRSKDETTKVNRGEKEAIATILFQHTIENIDFRERQRIKPPTLYRAFQLSVTKTLLPSSATSRKLAKASPTAIGAYHQNVITKMSISALKAWPKLGLKPHNGTKDVQAVVIAPKLLLDDAVRLAIPAWLESVSHAWRICGFGKHVAGDPEDCIFALDCGASQLSESVEIQSKLAEINSQISRRIAGDHGCVIYILVDDADCQTPSSSLMYLCLRLHLLRKGAIPHIVPLSSLASGTGALQPSGHPCLQQSLLQRFVFNVYDRLSLCITRHPKEKKGPNSISALLPEAVPFGGHLVRAFVAPAFQLVPPTSPQVALQLQWPPPALDVLDAHRLFHVSYHLSDDGKWLYMAAVDDRAEYNCLRVRFIEGLEVRLILRRVWNFLKEASECASVEWRICITRLGAMPVWELQAWCELMQQGLQQLIRPCMITLCTVTQTPSSTSETAQQVHIPEDFPTPLSGINLGNASNAYQAEGQPLVCISQSHSPTPVYAQQRETAAHLPTLPEKLYYALASCSTFFPGGELAGGQSSTIADLGPATPSYKIDLLAAATHPLSSYNRQLGHHMSDVAQSFVDLFVLGRERWSNSPYGEGAHIATHLPWHLASVSHMPSFDLESLLPS